MNKRTGWLHDKYPRMLAGILNYQILLGQTSRRFKNISANIYVLYTVTAGEATSPTFVCRV